MTSIICVLIIICGVVMLIVYFHVNKITYQLADVRNNLEYKIDRDLSTIMSQYNDISTQLFNNEDATWKTYSVLKTRQNNKKFRIRKIRAIKQPRG